jgi:hypothetical protein
VTDDVEAIELLARARGFDLTLDEAGAIRDQLAGIRDGLERARATIDVDAEEPASSFSPAGASG